MTLHRNARTCPSSRRLIARRVLEQGWSLTTAAEAAGVSVLTARKWVRRYREQGEAGLQDRSSAPHRVPNRTPQERRVAVLSLRRARFTGEEIAEMLGMPPSTISLICKRAGLGRLPRLGGAEQPRRYERALPGELIHIDVKKLGRISRIGHRIWGDRRGRVHDKGWEFVHVCVDDATRLAYAEVLADEHPGTAIGFLRRACSFFASFGVEVKRVMTDNGNAYRSTVHAVACRELGVRHLRTEAYRPQTNGKAERFIRTLIEKWAYGAVYSSSRERTDALRGWLEHYNGRRPHRSIGRMPPVQRLLQLQANNVLEAHT